MSVRRTVDGRWRYRIVVDLPNGDQIRISGSAPKNENTQAAAKQAEKERKKNSTDPADMGRIKQIVRAYQLTHEHDRALPFILLATFLLPVVIAIVVSLFWHHLFNLLLVGIMVGLLLTMLMLVRRTKAATYKRYAGQAGSAEVALQMLPKQWISAPVIAANRNRDVVHRTLGPGGLVLIGEGEQAAGLGQCHHRDRPAVAIRFGSSNLAAATGRV